MTDKNKSNKKLEEELTIQKRSCFETWDKKIIQKAFVFAEGYKNFLNHAKTEREAVFLSIKEAEKKGFKNIKKVSKIKSGDKIYLNHRGKSALFAKIGKKDIKNGFKLIMSHVDSPRMDFKVTPLYEEEGVAFLKTHYYGGIKKYQWPTVPLSLHGIVYLENGKEVEIKIGEKEDEPIFMITDLLPHLDRSGSPGSVIKPREILGEDLNLITGSIPIEKNGKGGESEVKEKVKLAVLKHLKDKYGIKEEDLSSAELSAVPSEKARDLGFDKSLISAYGHDDKICAFSSLEALFNSTNSEKTQICALVDREEIGTMGTTSARSIFFENFLAEISQKSGGKDSISEIYKIFNKSIAISADVSSALDPDYKDVYDPRNTHKIGYGLTIEKYTGSGGKYSTSEASGEFVRDLRVLFKKENVPYQLSGGLGKIDQGGGGTIAMFMANRDIEIIDAGVALFNMHAPLEIASKADIYSAYLGYKAFFEKLK